jgi:Winged helix domain
MTKRAFTTCRFVLVREGVETAFTLQGRDAWALSRLVAAGAAGVTPHSEPTGPRWSAYIHDLRHEMGLDIETITEKHGGPFRGTHARYVLHDEVRLISQNAGSDSDRA